MLPNQIVFTLVFAVAGIALILMNEIIATYMTEQWLKASAWLIPLKIREGQTYPIYKNLVYCTYRITFYGGAILCLGAAIFMLGSVLAKQY